AKRNNNSDSVNDINFLISTCLKGVVCGGTSDRLQDMPYNVLLANQTNRVLLIRWEIPAPLENFLVPPTGGIDWSITDELYDMLKAEGNWYGLKHGKKSHADIVEDLRRNETDQRKKVVKTIRSCGSAVTRFREYERDVVGHNM
ncbi:MAG: hypothetical protein ACQ9ET_06185, partial [Nitrosomonadaceae bacterium]